MSVIKKSVQVQSVRSRTRKPFWSLVSKLASLVLRKNQTKRQNSRRKSSKSSNILSLKAFFSRSKQKQFTKAVDNKIGAFVLRRVDRLIDFCLMLSNSIHYRPKRGGKKSRKVRFLLFSLVGILGIQASVLAFMGVPNLSQFFNQKLLSLESFGRMERLEDITATAAERYRLEPELVWAVIAVESNFNPKAKSKAGAMGLMQLMPATAKELLVEDPWSPEQNVLGGAKYLRSLLDTFDGDLEKTVAAYNAGPGAVRKYGGIPPYRETRGYVKKVMKRYQQELAKRGPVA